MKRLGFALLAALAACSGPTSAPVSATLSTLSASPAGPINANGSATYTLTVTVKDENGAPLSGRDVVLSATGTGNILSQPAQATNEDGVATGTLASSVVESKEISATASGQELTKKVTVVFATPVAAPAGLAYSTNPAVYTQGTAIAPNTPSNSGGTIATYSIQPPLPAGLSLNPTTGVITGTPTATSAASNYTITGTNAGGSVAAQLSVAVNAAAPANLAYSSNPAVYFTGAPIPPNTPSHAGGAPTSYSVSPALPAGLSLNTSTGVITGTPTAVTPAASYTVTATNSTGSTTAMLSVTVNIAPPGSFTYATNPAIYTRTVAITPNAPSASGGAVASYAVSPALPAGLILNTSTGVISGTPTALSPATNYAVMATNASGTTTVLLNLTVRDVAPSALTYSANPAVYFLGTAITANTPSSSGGAVVSYSVSPSLPAGLALNASTGVITGAPTALVGTTTYTITATNTGGSTTALLSITVNALPPAGLTYSTPAAVYFRDEAIVDNTPSSTGGAVVSYAVSPALPAGLSLNSSTGVISGTPTVITAAASHTVTATNSGGSTTATLSIEVKSPAGAFAVGDMNIARYGHAATLLNDGRVLITGGAASGLSELYDPATKTFSNTGSLATPRANHGAVKLPSGKVLVVGGYSNASSGVLASAELYDPATGTFSATGSLNVARHIFSIALLGNGEVLVAGGAGGSSGSTTLSSAELYDPATGTWSATGALTSVRKTNITQLLANGKVLLATGLNADDIFSDTASSELYDPATGTFNATGSVTTARSEARSALLPDGRVLVAGGLVGGIQTAAAELYDPVAGTFSNTGSLIVARRDHTATALPNGKVLITCGLDGQNANPVALVELYDPATGTFSDGGNLVTARFAATATLLLNGKVLITGGAVSSATKSAEVYTAP